jgi:hypothetical protein
MYIYYCWVTALLPSYQDGIVAGLAQRGYMVGPAAKDGKVAVSMENCPGVLFALSVYREEETNVNKIYDDVVAILLDMKAYYYSVIVSLSHEATWVGPNFQIPAKNKALPPPLPPTTKKNMN